MPNITADDLNDVIYVLLSYRDKNKDVQIHIPVSTSVYLRPQLPSKTSSSSLESYPWRILVHQYQSPRELAIYKTMWRWKLNFRITSQFTFGSFRETCDGKFASHCQNTFLPIDWIFLHQTSSVNYTSHVCHESSSHSQTNVPNVTNITNRENVQLWTSIKDVSLFGTE